MSAFLSEPAPAKVNLTLGVTGRRADGYHELDSLVVFGPAADLLHGAAAADLSLRIQGPFASGLADGADNLVLRAARALAEATGHPAAARLVLHKQLPVASGIGGGSADAAAALRLLCRLWGVRPDGASLHAVALQLGADVPVCLRSQPARMEGIGERLSPVPPVPPCGVLLANPGIAMATADVFRARSGPFSPPAPPPGPWPDAAGLAAALRDGSNDLEQAALAVQPAVGAVLATLRGLPGALLARMSGSGATCFALFATPGAAGAAAPRLPTAWWRSAGPLYEPPQAALFTSGWGVAKR